MRVYAGAVLMLAVLAAGAWRIHEHRQEGRRHTRRRLLLEDRNNLRNIVALSFSLEKLPMKDGAFDPYHLVRNGDITGTNIKALRSQRSGIGPTEEEATAGDYTKFPWERYRGEPKPRGASPYPLLWEKTPDEEGRVLVALSDGTTYVWDRETLERTLAEAGVGR